MSCQHPESEPVDVRSPITGATETVARICTTCLEQLPVHSGADAPPAAIDPEIVEWRKR